MQADHDERIDCAECGASFVFTSAEAAFYREKNLTAPKRCKACRVARRAARPAGARAEGGRPAPSGPGRRPRYTNDVNEYRSPMQDPSGWTGAPSRGHEPEGARRSPGPHRAARRPARDDRAHDAPSRPRSHGAMFDVTCRTCGVKTQVPFRPVEGRDVFCQPCYRARKNG